MKKGLILTAVILLAFATVLVGCSSAPKVYDKSVPLEESSTIIINGTITKFDGKNVLLKSMVGLSEIPHIIPAGEHTFSGSYKTGQDAAQEDYINLSNQVFNFLPGHTYYLHGRAGWNEARGNALGNLRIFDATELLKDVLEPDTSNPDASPFEGKWVDTKNEGNYFVFAGNQYFTFAGGKYQIRGFFSYEENEIRMSQQALYWKGQWNINSFGLDKNITSKATCNGTTFTIGKYEYRKVE